MVITIIASLIFLVWSMQYVLWNIEKESSPSLWNIPLYAAYISSLIGFLLMALYSIINVINKLKVFGK